MVGGTGASKTGTRRAMIFMDGENLLSGFAKNQAAGATLRVPKDTLSKPVLWNPRLAGLWGLDVIRITYYTSQVGTHEDLLALEQTIAAIKWMANRRTGQLVPRVFKKQKRGEKTKSVDINIVIDVLRHCRSNDVDTVVLMSGDGDYLPLLREVMRDGKQAYVAAFTNDMDPVIQSTVDSFLPLDTVFFL